jgi:hypothetical protein
MDRISVLNLLKFLELCDPYAVRGIQRACEVRIVSGNETAKFCLIAVPPNFGAIDTAQYVIVEQID